MNSLSEAIILSQCLQLPNGATTRGKRDLSAICRDLLEEASELGLTLDDVIDAVRRNSTPSNHSH